MSLDLKIIPVEAKRWELQSGFGLQYERDSLMFVGDYRIFEQIQETVPTHPLPEGVKLEVYSEGGIEHRRNDSYGDELTFVLAGDLKKIQWPTTELQPWNRAIKAFIKALPNDTCVILFWC